MAQPRFYGVLYPGRLNHAELNDHRAVELYEAILGDLVFMGVITEDQFKQYTHRYIQHNLIHPRRPYYDPLLTSIKRDLLTGYTEVLTDDGERPTYGSHVSVANAPDESGTDVGEVWYTLTYDNGWYVIKWVWKYNDDDPPVLEWLEDSRVPAENFDYVVMRDGDEITAQYVLLSGTEESDPPTWNNVAPEPHVLPPNWQQVEIDETATGETAVMEINLTNGETRQVKFDGKPLFYHRIQFSVPEASITPDKTFYKIAGFEDFNRDNGYTLVGLNSKVAKAVVSWLIHSTLQDDPPPDITGSGELAIPTVNDTTVSLPVEGEATGIVDFTDLDAPVIESGLGIWVGDSRVGSAPIPDTIFSITGIEYDLMLMYTKDA
jgi:hypothetical protein